MALSESVLSSLLVNDLVPEMTEAAAIANLVGIWDDYFQGASVGGVLTTPGSYAPGLSALAAGLVGMSAPGAAAGLWTSALGAFWAAIAPLAPVIWVTAPVVLVPPIAPPAGLAGLSGALTMQFVINASGALTKQQVMDALAGILHSSAGLGAIVAGSVPPAPPAPLPVL